jgi:hypothetical protein
MIRNDNLATDLDWKSRIAQDGLPFFRLEDLLTVSDSLLGIETLVITEDSESDDENFVHVPIEDLNLNVRVTIETMIQLIQKLKEFGQQEFIAELAEKEKTTLLKASS